MRLLLLLTGSLVLAVVFFGILLVTGVLKFGDNSVITKVQPVGEKVISKVSKTLDALPNTVKNSSLPVREKILTPLPRSDGTSPPIAHIKTLKALNTPVSTDRSDAVHKKALEFLRANAGRADIENRFADFLMVDLGFDQSEAGNLVRMSFWKNFVVLQQKWHSGERDRMKISFTREMALKKAGFAAMGLTLMDSEINDAEARLRQLTQQLLGVAQEGGKS